MYSDLVKNNQTDIQKGFCTGKNFLHNRTYRDFNTLTANYECSRGNTENLQLPIQMQLLEKLKTFSEFFITFLEFTLNFEHFEKN